MAYNQLACLEHRSPVCQVSHPESGYLRGPAVSFRQYMPVKSSSHIHSHPEDCSCFQYTKINGLIQQILYTCTQARPTNLAINNDNFYDDEMQVENILDIEKNYKMQVCKQNYIIPKVLANLITQSSPSPRTHHRIVT